jgi:ankyrin repeat protein
MAFLHDKLKESQDSIHGIIRLDFFFTARGTEMQRTPLGMLRSLLNQIFDRDATIRPQVRDIYEQRCRQFGYGERKWEWPQTILEELLATAILASANEQPVIIFVDALDEAGAESAQKLAAYFHRLVDRADKKKLTLQVCISCRHYPILESARAKAIHVEDHNQDDIATYIKDTLLETELEDVPNLEMREVLVEELTQHAKGVFQWAHLIMPLVKQKVVEGESISDIRDWLGDIPADLENVYVYILSNVITARNRDQSFLFFQWVCLAERPLTIVEIRYALAAQNAQITSSRIEWEKLHGFVESNERMKRRVKAIAGGLAEVVSSGNDEETVQVVHQSVNDFLRAKGLALLYHGISASVGSGDINNILSQSQATLYRSCLVYLATICSNKQMSKFRGSKEKLVCEHPFVNYATINIFIHAEKAAGSRGALLQNEKDTLQRMIGYWVEIYRRLDTYHTACPPTGTTVLHMAAAANLVDVVISVLSDEKDIERKNEVGNTALHFAARAGHTTAGKILQERGANREAKNIDGATPLMEAARCGHLGFVGWLLDEGVEIETGGGGALQKASLEGYSAIVVILLGAGANVNAQGGEYGNALQAAAWSGSAKTVKILLDARADVNTQGGEYGNALQAAAWSGSAEIVKILLDARADVNTQGGEYGNALQVAAWRGSAETVKILLDAQADVNTQGGQHGSPLLAAIYSGHADVIEILFHAGADIGLTDALDQTPLHIAASKDMAHLLFRFPQLASTINKRNKLLQTPLHLAICFGHIHFAIKLLHLGADPSLPDGYGRHAMDWAIGQGTLMREIRERCPQLSFTPREIQESIVQQSLFHLSDSLPGLSLNYAWLILQQLARCFLFLDDTNNARHLFQVRLSHNSSLATHMGKAICHFCSRPITGPRSVCRICANMDICSSCVLKHPFHHKVYPDQKHGVFEMPGLPDNESQLTGPVSQQLINFLNQHSYEPLGKNTNQSEMKLSKDASSLLSREKNTLVPNTSFKPVVIFSAILFGLLATFLGSWYF